MSAHISVEKYVQLNGHKGAVYAITKADLPNHVFTAGSDGIIARWDVENGISSGALAQIQAPIFSLFFDAENHLLYAGREDGGLHIIDVRKRAEIKLLKNHEKGVFSIIKHNHTIYTSGGDGTVASIDCVHLSTSHVFKASGQKVRGLYFSAKKNWMYAASADGFIRIFPSGFPKPFLEWHAHEGAANTVVELSGNRILSGGRDARLKLWEIDGDKIELIENIPAHNYAIYKIEAMDEAGIIITCSRDKNVKIWNKETLQVLKRIERVKHGGHKNSVNDFLYLDGLNKLITVSDDSSVIVWQVSASLNQAATVG